MSEGVVTRLAKGINFVPFSNKKKKKSLQIGRNMIDEYLIMNRLDVCYDNK